MTICVSFDVSEIFVWQQIMSSHGILEDHGKTRYSFSCYSIQMQRILREIILMGKIYTYSEHNLDIKLNKIQNAARSISANKLGVLELKSPAHCLT